MTLSWYSFVAYPEGGGDSIFNGFFKVDNDTHIITGFYETIDGTTDFNANILGPSNYPFPADNIFVDGHFGYNGTNITSIPLQTYFATTYPYFNIFYNGGDITVLYGIIEDVDVVGTFNVTYEPISDPSCFNEGTKILCFNQYMNQEIYIPIEQLQKGDLVKTYKHGYKKIDMIGKNRLVNNPSNLYQCMYVMKKTDTNGLIEDLVVTGGHAVLVDSLGSHIMANTMALGSTIQIDDKYLLAAAVSRDFEQLTHTQTYTYYHLTLENGGNHDKRFGVWANGVLTETPSKNQFIKHGYRPFEATKAASTSSVDINALVQSRIRHT